MAVGRGGRRQLADSGPSDDAGPDAIASYQAGDGRVYLVTANEGDARDYAGFSEEARVKDLTMDPAAFQGAAALREDGELGRLKRTTILGDTDNDGDYDVTYPANARFVDYVQEVNPYGKRFTSGDIGTEGLAVVSAEESPTGTPLLLVANEWSQTTTVYEIVLSGR